MNQTLLAGALGLALTGLVSYNLVHVPQRRAAELIRQQIAEEQKHRQAQVEVSALLKEVEQHRTQMPPEPDPAWLVQKVVELGREAGVQLTGISQDVPQRVGEFTRLSVAVEITASYHQLGTFLDQLEQSDGFIRVERIDISPSWQQREDGGLGAIRLVLSTLYLPSLAQQLIGEEAGG